MASTSFKAYLAIPAIVLSCLNATAFADTSDDKTPTPQELTDALDKLKDQEGVTIRNVKPLKGDEDMDSLVFNDHGARTRELGKSGFDDPALDGLDKDKELEAVPSTEVDTYGASPETEMAKLKYDAARSARQEKLNGVVDELLGLRSGEKMAISAPTGIDEGEYKDPQSEDAQDNG